MNLFTGIGPTTPARNGGGSQVFGSRWARVSDNPQTSCLCYVRGIKVEGAGFSACRLSGTVGSGGMSPMLVVGVRLRGLSQDRPRRRPILAMDNSSRVMLDDRSNRSTATVTRLRP